MSGTTAIDVYQDRCEQLFLAGGNAAVRRAAQEGLDELGPQPDLYCWLALGHAVEDDDDHDDRAEEAFRAGLALDAGHLGLLAGYAELCLRADAFEYPGRAARASVLSRRLKELAPESAEAQRLAAAERWARRGYWDDIRMRAVVGALQGRDTEAQARALAEDLRQRDGDGGDGAITRGAGSVDRATIVRAATLEALSGPWNAPVRLLGRYRTAAWAVSLILCFATNTTLRRTGVVDHFSVWGYLWLVPVLIVDRRFAAVRKEAEARHVAHLEAVLAERS
ncbi:MULTISPECIES: hypothetical protein [unclassified Streptomyces]|uniref:hypothetical protein n=1 Tax=unclassified Streptomyces TaxID=2593676 RepID=UPI0019091F75|nr:MULTISPECIES: hypothetical protein [unclassified Streptomyces]MBK3567863.1 hypothetical protein [Streptomyces sp. MBT62]MBK6016862.1 hypothetical protein [Streptomyces sp. MBT53]